MNLSNLIKNAKPLEVNKHHWRVHLSIANTEKRNSQTLDIYEPISIEAIIANINTSHQSGHNLKDAIVKRGLLSEINFSEYKLSYLYHQWITGSVLFNFSALDWQDYD